MRVLIVEDEEILARRLQRLLRLLVTDQALQIQHAASLDEALAWLSTEPIDVLFLDLNLHGQSGFQILGQALSRPFQTIIVSAHEEQAIEAFEYGVTDFIAKPYGEARLRKALQRLQRRDAPSRDSMRFLAVRLRGQVRAIAIDELLYVQGADDYSELHCRDGSHHLHDKSLNALAHLLPNNFLRIHRSYLVNLAAVESLRSEPGSRYLLTLSNGQQLPVSRARLAQLRERLI